MTKSRTAKGKREAGEISLSALLNVIDGVASAEGRILIMKANHIEKLDAALIRPGRLDMKVEFKYPEKPQLIQIFKGLFSCWDDASPDIIANGEDPVDLSKARVEEVRKACSQQSSVLAEQFAENIPGGRFSPAEIQGYLLNWKEAPKDAVKNAAAWAAKSKALTTATFDDDEEEEEEEEEEDDDSIVS